MVTAGIFLLIRFAPLLEYAPTALVLIVIVGSMTAIFAASVGLVQNDIKKVIAYSTCSQLGYMAFACGLSNYSASLFHLVNHGFFKALLFLSAGCVIHSLYDEQDMRKYGSLIRSLPYSYAMILIGSLSLMGFPFLTGFYSKDAIIELAYGHYSLSGYFAHWLGSMAAFFTAFYSIRLIYLTFLNKPNASQKINYDLIHESPFYMTMPLFFLALGSIFFGYIFRDLFIGLGTPFFDNSLITTWKAANSSGQTWIGEDHAGAIAVNAEFIPTWIKMLPVLASLLGSLLAFVVQLKTRRFASFDPHRNWAHKALRVKIDSSNKIFGAQTINNAHRFPVLASLLQNPKGLIENISLRITTFLSNKWHFDYLYNNLIVKPLLVFSHNVSYKVLDRGYIELFGPKGLTSLFVHFGARQVSDMQSGWVYNYAFSIFFSTTLFLIYFVS